MADQVQAVPAPIPTVEASPPAPIPTTEYHPLATPERVRGIIQTESHGDPKAINPDTGAIGLGQFLPSTAKELGIDPTNPDQAEEGVRRYYSKLLYKTGGDEDKALAKYGGFVTKDPTGYINKVKANTPPQPIPTADSSIPPPIPTQEASVGPPQPTDTTTPPSTPTSPTDALGALSTTVGGMNPANLTTNFMDLVHSAISSQIQSLAERFPHDPILMGADYLREWGEAVHSSALEAVKQTEQDPEAAAAGITRLGVAGTAGFLSTMTAGALLMAGKAMSPSSADTIAKIIQGKPLDAPSYSQLRKEAISVGQSVENYIWAAIQHAGETEDRVPWNTLSEQQVTSGAAGKAIGNVVSSTFKPVTDFTQHIGLVAGPEAGAVAEQLGDIALGVVLPKIMEGTAYRTPIDMGGGIILDLTPREVRAYDKLIKAAKNSDLVTAAWKDTINAMQQILDLKGFLNNRDAQQPDPGKTPLETSQRLLDETVTGPGIGGVPTSVSYTQILDLLAQRSDLIQSDRFLAENFLRAGTAMGLDKVKIKLSTQEEIAGLAPKHADSVAIYDPRTDTIHVTEAVKNDPTVLLHEGQHAITELMAQRYEAITTKVGKRLDDLAADPNSGWAEKPPLEQLYLRKMEKIHDLMDVTKRPVNDWIEALKTDKDKADAHRTIDHAYSTLGEFIAAAQTEPIMITALQSIPGRRMSEMDLRNINASDNSRSMQGFWTQYKNAFGGGDPYKYPTRHMEAINAITDVTDMMDPSHRHIELPGNRKENLDQAHQTMLDLGQWAGFQMISHLMQTVTSFQEFKWRLEAQSLHPEWRQFVDKNAMAMYRNGKNIIDAVGVDHSYDKLSQAEKAWIGDPRNAKEIFAAVKEKLGPDRGSLYRAEDLTWAGNNILGPDQLRILKGPKRLSGEIYNWFLSQANQYRSLKQQVFHEYVNMVKDFTALSHPDKIEAWSHVINWDGMWKPELVRQKLQWPTEDMLTAKGASPEVARAYLGRAKAMDWLLDRMNDIKIRNGESLLRAEPGFMVHTWEHPYRVFVKSIDKITGKEELDHVKDFMSTGWYNRGWGANKYAKLVQSGAIDNDKFWFRVDVDPEKAKGVNMNNVMPTGFKDERFWRLNYNAPPVDSAVSGLQAVLGLQKNSFDKSPEEILGNERLEQMYLQGASAHMMERINAKGFLGQEGIENNFWTRIGGSPSTEKILQLDHEFARAIADHYGNSMFVHEVVGPSLAHLSTPLDHRGFYAAMLDNVPELTWRMRQYTSNFTGQNFDLFHRVLTREIAFELHDVLGTSPGILKNAVNILKNDFALLKLRGNPGFYLGNVIQPAFSFAFLHFANAMFEAEGKPTISPFKTLVHMATLNLAERTELASATAKARDQHILDSQLTRALQTTDIEAPWKENIASALHVATGSKINPAIEDFGRTKSFQYAYQHFKDMGLSPEQAFGGASSIMRLTMIDYMRESRPLMFQNFGIAGQAISPFQVYRNAQLGNLYAMTKFLLQNKTNLNAYYAVASTLAIYFATAGAVGLPLMDMYDGVVNSTNKWAGTLWPNSSELMRKAGMPVWAMLGMVSNGLSKIPGLGHGVYLGSSLGAPEVDQGLFGPMYEWLGALAQTVGLGAQAAIHTFAPNQAGPVTTEDIYKASQPIVPGVLGWIRDHWVMPEGSDVVPGFEGSQGAYRRDSSDWNSLMWFGRRSNTEVIGESINASMNRKNQLLDKFVNKQIQSAGDAVARTPSQDNFNNAMKAALDTHRIDDQEFWDRVNKNVVDRHLVPIQRDAVLETLRGYQMRQMRREQSKAYDLEQ